MDVTLSRAELEVARLVAEGLPNKEICSARFVTVGAVKTHITNINKKLGTRSRVEIALWFIANKDKFLFAEEVPARKRLPNDSLPIGRKY